MREYRVIYLLAFCIFASWSVTSSQDTLPFSDRSIPSETPEPTDIISDEAEDFDTSSNPLTLKGNGGNETAFILNTGFSLEVILRDPETTETATGAIFGNKKYVFFKIRFYWTNCTGNENEAAYTTVNGKNGNGPNSHKIMLEHGNNVRLMAVARSMLILYGLRRCVEAVMQYYNMKYSSFREGLEHRDGLFQLNIRINVGTKDNPKFKKFASAAKNVRTPGQSSDLPLFDAYSWFRTFPENINYHVFPGAYTNQSRNEMFYCTTTAVVGLNEMLEISDEQYKDVFLDSDDFEDDILINDVENRFPLGDRPLVEAHKIVQKVDPDEEYKPSIL